MPLSPAPIGGAPPIPAPADPFATFTAGLSPAPVGGAPPILPPSGVTSATPLSPAPIDTWGPGGDPTLNSPLTLTPAAQSPLGANGNAPPIVAPGGADYPPFTNDATGRVGDSPYRRVKRGGFQPMQPVAPMAVPDGMRAL